MANNYCGAYMRKNNKGISFIELIVVIAIMAVMLGVAGYSLNLLLGVEARQATQKISAQLNETKTGSMSRYEETMTLSYKGKDVSAGILSDGYYAQHNIWTIQNKSNLKKEVDSEIRKVASEKVVITLYTTDGLSMELGTSNRITISYDRSSGAMDPITINGTEKTGIYPQKMIIKSGVKEYTIAFTHETGKHTIQ